MLALVLSSQMQIVIGICDFPAPHTALYSVPVQTLCLSGTNINLVLISLQLGALDLNDVRFHLYHVSHCRIFLKIHTCNIVPICYKCWKFSFDGSKFKGTLYVDQCTFLLVSRLPLEGFHSSHTWNSMGIHWIIFKFGCDHSKIKGILCGDQCISTTLEGFSWQFISVTRHIFHTNCWFNLVYIKGHCTWRPTYVKGNVHEHQCTVLPLLWLALAGFSLVLNPGSLHTSAWLWLVFN